MGSGGAVAPGCLDFHRTLDQISRPILGDEVDQLRDRQYKEMGLEPLLWSEIKAGQSLGTQCQPEEGGLRESAPGICGWPRVAYHGSTSVPSTRAYLGPAHQIGRQEVRRKNEDTGWQSQNPEASRQASPFETC